MPYFLLASVLLAMLGGPGDSLASLSAMLTAYAIALPLATVSALLPLVRPLAVAGVRALGGVPVAGLAEGPARSWAERGRTSAWWTLHLGLGALVSGLSLAMPPMAGLLLAAPLLGRERRVELGMGWFADGSRLWTAPLAGLLILAVVVGCAAVAGALLARAVPVLLGPSTADRLAAAEERAADLAVRNRLARELHDAVGHALSAVTLQAVAARRVLDRDPEFVREALAAIEDTTRRTVGELDTVLGLLRDGDAARPDAAPAPTLGADLAGLLARTRATGAAVTAYQDPGPVGSWEALPAIVSREAYRIVQEGLSNALRHGAGGPVELHLAVREKEETRVLEIVMTNVPAAPGGGPAGRGGGGRGLRGAGERAALLGGSVEAGPDVGRWRLRAVLPLGGGGR
ncbi:histidine kinase [Streptomyces sp. SMC 277]|uniref:histidine kinase n=2 Tax=Streptomyces antimicrobicus TaxID=2883108 RepID=A0ABS8BFE7_9ACTN|nr:histidine kinase [Streptomyces antimicrobicus]MCB5183352.1 histidine kinase [Streptomyces antimicrobicus]